MLLSLYVKNFKMLRYWASNIINFIVDFYSFSEELELDPERLMFDFIRSFRYQKVERKRRLGQITEKFYELESERLALEYLEFHGIIDRNLSFRLYQLKKQIIDGRLTQLQYDM